MTYELAKKLRDQGFPQIDGDYVFDNGLHARIKNVDGLVLDGAYYSPSLSELIEACGDNLVDLTRTDEGWATNLEAGGTSNGKTPEEAVARLWLALNNKQ